MPGEPLNLPAVTPGGEVEADILDGEIVPETEAKPTVIVLRPVFQTVTIVVRHPRTRAVARHAAYIPAGAVVLARRRRLPARMAAAAELAGDHATALLWEKHQEERKQRRREHRLALAELLMAAARALPKIIIGGAAGLGATSVLLWFKDGVRGFLLPWQLAEGLAQDSVTAFATALAVAPVALPVAGLLALYAAGRRGGDLVPGWARTAADGDVDVTIDERAVTQAIANLRIPQVRDYLKAGQPLQFPVACRQEGRGTYFEVRLPGVPAEKIMRRRTDFAAGLHRLPKEVWPSMGGEAAILKGWIADKGALEEGAGPYPLLSEGFTDVFKGLPFGRSLRGDPVKIPVIGRNSICGGAPEQGKSNGARGVAAGYTLDIVTELRLYIPDTNFDFERFKPRTASYVMGAEDEYIERILGELEELKEEIQKRGQLLVDAEAEEVTWELAHAGIGLHPVFVLLEEAHVVIQHAKYGKGFRQLLPEIVKLDRKRGIHMMVSTQAPTKDSMPRDVTRNCTVGIAYAVGDHVANDALLGQGAYAAGHRATELIPGTDRGTALVKGFAGEARSEMVQAYRVSGRNGDDQVTPIVNRALAAMAAEGRAVPGTGRTLAIEAQARDLLEDLAEVIDGPDRVRLAELPPRLRKLDKTWPPYRALDGVQLAGLLDRERVPWVRPKNVPQLDPAELHKAIAERGELAVPSMRTASRSPPAGLRLTHCSS